MTARRSINHLSRYLITLAMAGVCGIVLVGFTIQPPSPSPEIIPPESSPTSTAPTKATTIQECEVTFITGRKLTGILMKSDIQSVVLRINGIDTTYRRARIASVKFLPPVEERFKKFRAALQDSDIDARLMLVDWLRDRRAYELAVKELESILELEPHHPQAKTLKIWLQQHLKLQQSRAASSRKRTAPVSASPKKPSLPVLTQEQINLVRVYEIDLADPPKLKVDESTIKELMLRDPDSFPVDEQERQALIKGTDLGKLKILFRNKARDLYTQVRVLEDPASFQSFKKHLAGKTGWLTNGCATTRCHGGEQAGEFRLLNRKPSSPESLYTNFVILNQFSLNDGSALINYADPERSPLVQMGILRSRSLYPHPIVDPTKHGRDWRPVFRSTKSTNFKRSIDWIQSLYTPRPDYGFEYPPTPIDPEPPTTDNP